MSKRARTNTMDTDGDGDDDTVFNERDNKEQSKVAKLIPGVDGRLQFGFPTKIITKLRYNDTVVLDSTTGTSVAHVLRMNSAFDPDFTGTGHQPIYFDRYAAIYNSYRVIGAHLKVHFCQQPYNNDGLLGVGPHLYGINGSPTSTTFGTSGRNRSEQNDSIYRVVAPLAATGVTTLTWNFSPETKLDRPRHDDTVGALVTADPLWVYYAHIWVADLNAPANSPIYVSYSLEQTVEFFNLALPQAEN